MDAEVVNALVLGFVKVLGACGVVEAGVAFLTRAPADVDEAIG
jgi:hypothetical protein